MISVGLLVFLLVAGMQYQQYQRVVQEFIDHTAQGDLLRTHRTLERLLQHGDVAEAWAVVAELNLDPAIEYAAVLDANGSIPAATQADWRGQAVVSLPELANESNQRMQAGDKEFLWRDRAQNRLLAWVPINLASGTAHGAGSTGQLLIAYDLDPVTNRARQQMWQQLWISAAAGILLALLLFWLAQRIVLRPVAAFRAGVASIGEGDFNSLPQWVGRGEFRELGAALRLMAESEQRYRQLSDAAFEGVILHDNGLIIDANAAAEKLACVPPGGLVGRQLSELVPPCDAEASQQRIRTGMEGVSLAYMQGPDDEIIPIEINIRQRQIGGRIIRAVAVRDMRDKLAAEEEIRRLSQVDTLTGISNRIFLMDRVAEALHASKEQNHRSALIAINLDMFKSINDSLGMGAGDEVLRAVARRLSQLQSPGQTLARVNGDTFAMLITQLAGDQEAAMAEVERVTDLLFTAIGIPLEVRGQSLHLKAGAGVVMIPNDSNDPPELLRQAETAMHLAKQAGQNNIRFFANELQQAASARLAIRNDLQRALHAPASQLLLHYQPQINAQGCVVGVEALVRWQHPERGLIPPGAFISEAETSGLIVPLGNWVLEEAATCLRRWQQQADTADWAASLSMAVNVSPRQFREADFVSQIENLLARAGLDARSLELELTESVVVDDLEATLEKMMQLRQLGVRFALDDFGTGYSSLAYLKRLPIDTLKIDRSFVMDIDAPEQQRAGKRPAVLIDAIIAMAHQLDLRVLAEGVETPAQQSRLMQAGCDSFQGYHFARPLPEADLLDWINKHSAQIRAAIMGAGI